MKAGIVGLPNVGKSTLFNCLTKLKHKVLISLFTIEPNIGIVSIPDKDLKFLSQSLILKRLFATVEILDIAGLVKKAIKRGLGNQFYLLLEKLMLLFIF